MKPFVARFKGVCPNPCKFTKKEGKHRIEPGQDIVRLPGGAYKHAKCAGIPEQLKLFK